MIPFRGLALIVVAAGSFFGSAWYGQQAVTSPGAISVTDVFAFRDLHYPQMSPEGQWVAYTMGTVNREEDKNEERIWMVPAAEGETIPLTAQDVSSSHPRWSPDGNVARHIKMQKGAATLDEPAVQTLIAEALVRAKVPVPAGQKRRFLIKSVSAKQRPRRPSVARSKNKR